MRLTFSCGPSCCALCFLGPLRAGVALFFFVRPSCLLRSLFSRSSCPPLVLCPPRPRFFFSDSPPFVYLCAPPLSLAFGVFLPGVPSALASSCLPPPPLFFSCFSSLLFFLLPWLLFFLLFAFFSLCAPVVSCVPCFPARGALGLPVFLSPPPPPFVFFLSAFPRSFFFLLLRFFFCAPVVSGVPCFPARGALGLGALLSSPPPLLFFPSCLLLASCFYFPCLCLAGGAVRGWCVCPGLWGVLVCALVVMSLSLLFVRCSLAPLALAGVVWCCLSCLGVCCGAWLSSVAFWWVLVSCFGGECSNPTPLIEGTSRPYSGNASLQVCVLWDWLRVPMPTYPPCQGKPGSGPRPHAPRTGSLGRESARLHTPLAEARGATLRAPFGRPHSAQS